jgi:hypothetical protein
MPRYRQGSCSLFDVSLSSQAAGCIPLLLPSAIPRAHACVHVINRRNSQISASSRATRPTHVPTSLPARATPAPQESRSVRAQTLPRAQCSRHLLVSFKSHTHSILLATDIAARGLDIPLVSHVVHYQIPRTVDTYIHRNGRTARAQRSGFSLLVCAPDERRVVRALFGSLGRRGYHLLPLWVGANE